MDEVQIITPPVADETEPLDHGLVALTEAIHQINPDKVAHGFLGGTFGYGADWDNDTFTMRPAYERDCDCGWENLANEWSQKHKHLADCYWNVSRERVESSDQKKVYESALNERDKFKWGSKRHDAAQARVEVTGGDLKAHEQAIYKSLCEQHDIPWNDGLGCAVHCTCDHDSLWSEFVKAHPGHLKTCALELPNFLHKRTGLEVCWYKWIGRDTETKNAAGIDLQAVFAECLASLQPTADAVRPVKLTPQQGLPGEPNPSSGGETG